MSIAGRMDERITVEQVTRSVSALGEETLAFSNPCTVWANVMPERGSERLANSRLEESRAIVVKTRYEIDVHRGDRITWRGDAFRVQGAPEMIGRERFQEFVATAIQSAEVT